jgi:hypothetical protein
MFCDRCGTAVSESDRFCPSCGKSFAPPVSTETYGRVAGNVQTLAVLWLVYSAFRLVSGIFLASFLPRVFNFWPGSAFHMGHLMRGLGIFTGASSLLGLIAGWGLLERQHWARILAIIAAILALPHLILGTAIGVFTLWVLAPSDSGKEYERMSNPA